MGHITGLPEIGLSMILVIEFRIDTKILFISSTSSIRCDRETEKGQAFLSHKKEPTKNAKIKTQKERYPILQKTQKER